MTPEYDRVVGTVNRCLVEAGGEEAGAVQRLGAGWGGRAGGLVRRDCVEGEPAKQLAAAVREARESSWNCGRASSPPEKALRFCGPRPEEERWNRNNRQDCSRVSASST